MPQVDGLHVRVDRAAGASKDGAKGSVEYDRTCSVFVGNLPFDVEVNAFLPAGPAHFVS